MEVTDSLSTGGNDRGAIAEQLFTPPTPQSNSEMLQKQLENVLHTPVNEDTATQINKQMTSDDYKPEVPKGATKIDYLDEDEIIPNQRFGCFSFVSPEGIRNCKIRAFKCRGCYPTKVEAEAKAKELRERDRNKFNIFVGEIGKWLPWDPDPNTVKSQDYVEKELNELVHGYLDNMEKSKKLHEERKQELINTAKDTERSQKIKQRLKKQLADKYENEEQEREQASQTPPITGSGDASATPATPATPSSNAIPNNPASTKSKKKNKKKKQNEDVPSIVGKLTEKQLEEYENKLKGESQRLGIKNKELNQDEVATKGEVKEIDQIREILSRIEKQRN